MRKFPFVQFSFLLSAHSAGAGIEAPKGAGTGTNTGIVLPFGHGFKVSNVKFVNFDLDGTRGLMGTKIDGTCGEDCGGYHYQ